MFIQEFFKFYPEKMYDEWAPLLNQNSAITLKFNLSRKQDLSLFSTGVRGMKYPVPTVSLWHGEKGGTLLLITLNHTGPSKTES